MAAARPFLPVLPVALPLSWTAGEFIVYGAVVKVQTVTGLVIFRNRGCSALQFPVAIPTFRRGATAATSKVSREARA